LLGFSFNPEDRSDMFLRNVGQLSSNYTALYPVGIATGYGLDDRAVGV
jgi:hypothetical protein